ncbi:hypothetical protein J4212_00805 [Candidatus Woesearchaeota archaeon]|nr:hypothetical protein [Candidatus Woesearchaeota archaeon]
MATGKETEGKAVFEYSLGNWLTVAAPATVANLGVGFDVMGVSILNIEDVDADGKLTFLGDIVKIKHSEGGSPLEIKAVYVRGALDSSFIRDVNKNVAAIAAQEVLRARGYRQPLEIILEKMPFMGSGMGSSAASVVAGAYAALLISGGSSKEDIANIVVNCEVGKHPDNVLPALFGGFVASYGETNSHRRLQRLYDQDILSLSQAQQILASGNLGISDYRAEMEKAKDNDSISEIISRMDKLVSRFQKVREGQKEQYYSILYNSIQNKAKIHSDDPRLKEAISIIEESRDLDLNLLIGRLENLGIESISPDLERLRTYEKRRLRRIECDKTYTSPGIKKRLLGLVEEYIAKKRRESAPSNTASASTNDYETLSIPDRFLDNLYFVLIKPDISISTIEARKRINRTPDLGDVVANSRGLAKLLISLYKGDIAGFGEAMSEDRIVEPARAPLILGFYRAKEAARREGAYGFTISGSGPACVGVTDTLDAARNVARISMRIFGEEGHKSSAYICKVDTTGARKL